MVTVDPYAKIHLLFTKGVLIRHAYIFAVKSIADMFNEQH